MVSRCLNAHTELLAKIIQIEIVDYLTDIEEEVAAVWFDEYWTSEHGNWTNAAAGYAGTNNAQGIESRWRYFKRDTVGGAGTNMGISLRVFIPSMMAYMTAFSERHAESLLNPATGEHHFISLPVIRSEIWKEVQKIDTRKLGESPNFWERCIIPFIDL